MAGPSLVVRILGDIADFKKSVGDTASAGEAAASKMHSAFGSLLGTLNKTGVLGPFGEALSGVNDALGDIAKHGATIGTTMLGVGGALVGVGVGLQAIGSKDRAAHQQLQASVQATGQDYEDYAAQVDAAIKHMERFGDSGAQTQDALSKLTQATHDPQKALDLLGLAADVAASKHEDLGTAADQIGKVYNGNTKLLKTYGIAIDKTTGLTKDGQTATEALAAVTAGQAVAASDTFMGRLTGIKTHLEDSAAAFGQKYGPAITAAGGIMAGFGAAIDVATAARAALTAVEWASVPAQLAALAPILLIIAAVALLGVAIYELVKHWDEVWGFMKAIVMDVWAWIRDYWPYVLGFLLGPIALAVVLIATHFDTVKRIAADAVEFIKGAWNGLVSFFTGLPGRMAGIFSGMWDGIWQAFRAAINLVIDAWNGLHFGIPEFDTHIPGIGKVGGGSVGTPTIPRLAAGGVITSPTLALLGEAGPEAVIPLGAGRGGPVLTIANATFNSAVDVDLIAKKLEFAMAAGMRV